MSRTAQDLHHRRLHKCWDCATLVDLVQMYCPRCRALQDRAALLQAALAALVVDNDPATSVSLNRMA